MTIFALGTPPGKSGVAIIRISGPKALGTLRLFGYKGAVTPRMATLITVTSPVSGEIIDESLFVYFESPASFTGEDIVELQCHGSRAVITEIITHLSAMPGLRLAEPGEFSKRAFMNGKMDLTKAEGLADLIDAETSAQHRQAVRQMRGALESLYETWRTELIHSLAFIEAYIDFPDEDLPQTVIDELMASVHGLHRSISEHLDDNRRGEKIRDGLYIAIIGAPNVGKSSLINWLAKRDVAIVSHIAGTTRDIIEVHLDIAGYSVIIADTAGIRESDDDIENEGIRRAIERANHADLTIALFDASTLSETDLPAINLIDEKTLVVVNKIDCFSGDQIPLIKNKKPLPVSIKSGQGLDALIKNIEEKAEAMLTVSDSPIITRARYRTHLLACKEQLEQFHLDKDIELAAEDLRRAARFIGLITGRIDVETVLDKIFSSFCIGK